MTLSLQDIATAGAKSLCARGVDATERGPGLPVHFRPGLEGLAVGRRMMRASQPDCRHGRPLRRWNLLVVASFATLARARLGARRRLAACQWACPGRRLGLATEAGHLASTGWQVAGIDLFEVALARAAAEQDHAAFLRADVRRLPFHDHCLDAAVGAASTTFPRATTRGTPLSFAASCDQAGSSCSGPAFAPPARATTSTRRSSGTRSLPGRSSTWSEPRCLATPACSTYSSRAYPREGRRDIASDGHYPRPFEEAGKDLAQQPSSPCSGPYRTANSGAPQTVSRPANRPRIAADIAPFAPTSTGCGSSVR
jgi:methyltransferase family protein